MKSLWSPVLASINSRIGTWRNRLLSKAGRLTLLNCILSSIPFYYIFLFQMPKSVVSRIGKMLRRFFGKEEEGRWRLHTVRWETICRSKAAGGLWVRDLALMNQALLSKWQWRYSQAKEDLLRQIVCEHYGSTTQDWGTDNNNRAGKSGIWLRISSFCLEFWDNISYKVNAGTRILFWRQVWLGEIQLCSRYPRLFRNCMNKEVKIAEFGKCVWWATNVELTA